MPGTLVARFNPNLTLDTGFAPGGAGGDGIDVFGSTAILEPGDFSVAVRPDGVIGVAPNPVAAAAVPDAFLLLRWSEAGALLGGGPRVMPFTGDGR